ncbi:MAG: OmpH family outer membrane protein [Phycisphaerales bacterium]|nr:OmpH family outer membrane protein [Phycisphaerales bacterium]
MQSAKGITLRLSRHALGLVLGAALLTTLAWQAGANAARPPANPTAVAVVNLPKVLQSLDERTVRQDAMSKATESRQKQLDELTKRIEALNLELDPKEGGTIKPGTAEYRDKLIQLRELQVTLDARFKLLEQVLSFERGTIMRELYVKIDSAVNRIADRDGYDLVLLDDTDFKLPNEASQDDMNRAILSRSVLYRHNSIDITDQVVQLLNNEFKAGSRP